MAVIGFAFVGLVVGIGFSLLYLIAFFAVGGLPRPDGSIISPLAATVMYITTCTLGGMIMGTLRSFFHFRLGTAAVGVIGMAPAFVGAAALYEGSFTDMTWPLVVIGSLLVGIPMGFVIRKEYHSLQEDFGSRPPSRN